MPNVTVPPRRVEAPNREFDRFAIYADGDGTVLCDRKNPAAWIRSTVVRPVKR